MAVYDVYFRLNILPYMNTQPKSKLLQQVSNKIRFKHYSIRTEKSYLSWIKRYILHNKKRHSKDMGEKEIRNFPSSSYNGLAWKFFT